MLLTASARALSGRSCGASSNARVDQSAHHIGMRLLRARRPAV